MSRSRIFPLALVVIGIGGFVSLKHSNFVLKADGYIPPRTAVELKLLSDNDAPFSGGVAFQRDPSGGFNYRDASVLMALSSTSHTPLDLDSECAKRGACQIVRNKDNLPKN